MHFVATCNTGTTVECMYKPTLQKKKKKKKKKKTHGSDTSHPSKLYMQCDKNHKNRLL